jgi:hypothetical protein
MTKKPARPLNPNRIIEYTCTQRCISRLAGKLKYRNNRKTVNVTAVLNTTHCLLFNHAFADARCICLLFLTVDLTSDKNQVT